MQSFLIISVCTLKAWGTAGDVSPPSFPSSEMQLVLSGLGRQSSAWHPSEHPFASGWAPLTMFNLLNLYISNAKHQGGSFRSLITVGEETQPRAPHLST